MEILERVCQFVSGQITDQVVKHPQPVAQLTGMKVVLDDIRCGGCTDVGDRPPELTLMFHPVAIGIQGRQNFGNLPATTQQFWRLLCKTLLNVAAQFQQIAHHQFRLFEHLSVQALHDEG